MLSDCETLAALRFRHLSCHFFKLGQVTISVSKVLHFVYGVRRMNAQVNVCTDQKWSECKGHGGASLNVFYTFNLK
jgi:hypothetical protein